MSCHSVRPLLPARAEELTVFELRTRADHVAACARCATEAAAYSRLGHALEEYDRNTPIRPRAIYTGPSPGS